MNRSRSRNALIVFLAATGLCILAGHIYLQYALHASIEQGISRRLGTGVHLGLAQISLLPRGVQLSSLTIENPDGFDEALFIRTRDLRLSIDHYSRDSKIIESPELVIDDMDVWLERQALRSNSKTILGNLKSYEREYGITYADKTKLVIDKLTIRNLIAHLRMASASTKVEIPEIVLHDVGARQGGVTVGELAAIITQAALRAVLGSGAELPSEIASDLRAGLSGLPDSLREFGQRAREKTRDLGRKLGELFD